MSLHYDAQKDIFYVHKMPKPSLGVMAAARKKADETVNAANLEDKQLLYNAIWEVLPYCDYSPLLLPFRRTLRVQVTPGEDGMEFEDLDDAPAPNIPNVTLALEKFFNCGVDLELRHLAKYPEGRLVHHDAHSPTPPCVLFGYKLTLSERKEV